jgi:hypothetical protein
LLLSRDHPCPGCTRCELLLLAVLETKGNNIITIIIIIINDRDECRFARNLKKGSFEKARKQKEKKKNKKKRDLGPSTTISNDDDNNSVYLHRTTTAAIMGEKRTKVEALLDVVCPDDSQYYFCSGSGFIGCCASDPCAKSDQFCPQKDLRAIGYQDTTHQLEVSDQNCHSLPSDNSTLNRWWLCEAAIPPFFGCCMDNPCSKEGCAQADVRSAYLTHDEAKTAIFKDLADEDDGSGLSKGAIAGIAAGVGAAVIIAVAFLVWFCLKRKRAAARPAVPAKPESYVPNTPHTPHGSMAQFSPAPHSAHPTLAGSNYPYSPQQPGADSPAYYFHQQQQQQQQQGPPYFYNGVPVPPIHPPMPHNMPKAFYEQTVTPMSNQNYYAAELPSVPDTPAATTTLSPQQQHILNRAASTTTFKGSSNKRESAMSRMTAPPEAHGQQTHQLAELGPTHVTAEIGESTAASPKDASNPNNAMSNPI